MPADAAPLADHIGMVRRMAGGRGWSAGARRSPATAWSASAGAAVGPGEVVLATGTNVAGTDLEGRFRWLHGFWDRPPERPEPTERP